MTAGNCYSIAFLVLVGGDWRDDGYQTGFWGGAHSRVAAAGPVHSEGNLHASSTHSGFDLFKYRTAYSQSQSQSQSPTGSDHVFMQIYGDMRSFI